MHWKRTAFVFLILGLLFFVIWNEIACQGMCGVYQRQMSFVIFLMILFFTAIFLYYSLKLWSVHKEKFTEENNQKK